MTYPTGSKTKSVTHHELSLKKVCWYLIKDANVWIIDAIKKVLIYYSQVSQLLVVIKDSKWQLFYLIVVYVLIKRIRLEFNWELSKISQKMFNLRWK